MWRSSLGVGGSPLGAGCSSGMSFLADYEVDGSAQVLLGACDVGPVSYGDCLPPDYVLYVCCED